MSFLLTALLVAGNSAAAASQPSIPAVAPAAKEKKICKIDQNESSSRLRKRECLTETEWARRAAGKNVNDLKNIGAR